MFTILAVLWQNCTLLVKNYPCFLQRHSKNLTQRSITSQFRENFSRGWGELSLKKIACQVEGNNNIEDTLPDCMSRTYCPPFGIVVAHLVLILFSIGMLAEILWVLSQRSAGTISPMVYFFVLAFVAIIVLSTFILTHMLFVKRMIIPPPCL
jgi:hypothetical protein